MALNDAPLYVPPGLPEQNSSDGQLSTVLAYRDCLQARNSGADGIELPLRIIFRRSRRWPATSRPRSCCRTRTAVPGWQASSACTAAKTLEFQAKAMDERVAAA
jgi:hypothetical protein